MTSAPPREPLSQRDGLSHRAGLPEREPLSEQEPQSLDLREGLSRLLAKYTTLLDLRLARARGEPIPPKTVFQRLARESPGALHELDRLPLEDIESRREALRSALKGGPVAPWMPPMALYHTLYRAALFLRARLARGEALSPEQALSLARAAAAHAGLDALSPDFVRAVASPPLGRIGAVVLAEVAARTGQPAPTLLRSMFPTRRALPT